MSTPATIRRVGFRKWYERELLQSHIHLILLVLCSVAALGALEVFGSRASGASPLPMILCVLIAVLVGVWSLRRYLFLMSHAEHLADQAVCKQCEAYAKWDIVGEDAQRATLLVCCRRCGSRWQINY